MGSKKELQAAIAVLGLCMLVFGCTKTAESENSKKQVKIGVAVYNEEDVYVSKICGYLEDEIFQYEKDHPGVEIRKKIADARGSQQEQNDQIDQFISLDYDLLLVNIVDRTNAAVIIDKATQDSNEIRMSAIRYTDEMLENLEKIMSHTIDQAGTKYNNFINSIQSCYDIVNKNRMELSPQTEPGGYTQVPEEAPEEKMEE